MRAVELDERSRTQRRHAAAAGAALLQAGTATGYAALGWDAVPKGDRLELDAHDPALVGADPENPEDAIVFSATPRAVRHLTVAEIPVVRDGRHAQLERARAGYLGALRRLEF